MNEEEIREYLKGTKYRFVKVVHFSKHDRIVMEDNECRMSWNLRGHIEGLGLVEIRQIFKVH